MPAITVKPGYLTLICADLDARPLFWTAPGRTRHGYEPEIAAAVASRMELEIEWKFLRWADFTPALEAGEADAIWCGCAITPARSERFLFSRPYAIFHESVLVRRADPIFGVEDLRGRRVGAIAGSTNLALAQSWPGCEPVAFDGTCDDVFGEMIEALRSGAIDAVVDDEPAFGGVLADPAFKLAFTVPTGNRWGAAMRADRSRLKRAIDAALGILIVSGRLRRIWQQNLPRIDYPDLRQ